MKKLIIASLLIFSIFAYADTPEKMLEIADSIRNPGESYMMLIKVESADNNNVFEVYLKGQDKTLIVTKEPARDKGRNMLMLERDFHAYIPNLKRTMRLSLAQKLSGQVANGDISRTRWAGDYSVKLESENKDEVQLFLKANKDNLTYAAIRLWLKKANYQPLRANYLALNGETILKKASFEDYKTILGKLRPSTIKIEDAGGQASFIRIQNMTSKDLADSFFTTRNMESMK